MAHEGRGDIDQEKKGRPGHQTVNAEHYLGMYLPSTTSRPTGLAAAGGDVRFVTSVSLLYSTRRRESGQ